MLVHFCDFQHKRRDFEGAIRSETRSGAGRRMDLLLDCNERRTPGADCLGSAKPGD
jgi:hypothetical protein